MIKDAHDNAVTDLVASWYAKPIFNSQIYNMFCYICFDKNTFFPDSVVSPMELYKIYFSQCIAAMYLLPIARTAVS